MLQKLLPLLLILSAIFPIHGSSQPLKIRLDSAMNPKENSFGKPIPVPHKKCPDREKAIITGIPHFIHSRLTFNSLEFVDSTLFDSVVFHKRVVFDHCKFSGVLSFHKTSFRKGVSFKNCFFNEYYLDSINASYLDFMGCHFDTSSGPYNYATGISNAKIDILSITSCDSVNFPSLTYLNVPLVSISCSSYEDLYLQLIKTSKIVLDDITIKGHYDFPHKLQRLELLDVRFQSDFSLPMQETPDTLFLEGVEAPEGIRFSTYGDKKSTCLSLSGVDLQKVYIADISLVKLFFKDKDGKPFKPETIRLTYEGLLENFKTRGQTENYRLLDIEYQKFKDNSPYKIFSKIDELWWDFGYQKQKVFLNTLIILLSFCFISLFTIRYLNKHIYPLSNNVEEIHPDNIYNHLGRRIWFTVFYTTTIFLLLTLKTENLRIRYSVKGILGVLYLLLIHGAGLTCLVFIVNFILQK